MKREDLKYYFIIVLRNERWGMFAQIQGSSPGSMGQGWGTNDQQVSTHLPELDAKPLGMCRFPQRAFYQILKKVKTDWSRPSLISPSGNCRHCSTLPLTSMWWQNGHRWLKSCKSSGGNIHSWSFCPFDQFGFDQITYFPTCSHRKIRRGVGRKRREVTRKRQ